MSEEMANDSFQRIVNIDISNVVIGAMNEKHRNNPHLTCKFNQTANCPNNTDILEVPVINENLFCQTEQWMS